MSQISEAERIRRNSFGYLLHLVVRQMDPVTKEKLLEIGVNVTIFANLMNLSQKDGITQRELGEIAGFPNYHTSRNVDALIEAGFAVRRPDPDSRRAVRIFLTSKGRKKAAQLPGIINAVNEQFLAPLTANERKSLIKSMQKVAGLS